MGGPGPTGLPVEDCIDEVRRALAGAGHCVLQAPPGAGKTTLVPLRLLEEPWLQADQRIVVLEPRRLAARAAARRMAALLGEDVGATVGYRTRDEHRVGPTTRIEVVTEGILTRRLQHDPGLGGIGLVVFDEFHERSIHADLGLALTLEARGLLRPDLRVLVMSATLDGERVAALLGRRDPAGGAAPIVTSEGRLFDVDVRWLPRPQQVRVWDATAEAVGRAVRAEPGGVLAFLPGEGEIRRTADLLARAPLGDACDVRMLFGALGSAEQDAALAPAPPGRRKVVLATDIAETSLTVEGIRVVIDAGLARTPRFDPGTGMTRLVTGSASRASAEQRAGRAGRLEPGVAYRLWSKVEHAGRRAFSEPELTQVDLAGFALELAVWGTSDPSHLALLDAPPARSMAESRALLAMLGALGPDGRVTAAGRAMAALPLHPRLAHMVTAAMERGDGPIAVALAALLEERDVLRGRADELPADIAVRLGLLAEGASWHPAADRRALGAARRRCEELARRVGASAALSGLDPTRAGRVLALAYPDRIAQAREGASRGRFRLRTGSGAWVATSDTLAGERFIVAADLDGHRTDARVRLGAAVDEVDILAGVGDDVDEQVALVWDKGRDDLMVRAERRLGALRLSTIEHRPLPGPEAEAALLERVRATRLRALDWTDAATSVRDRVRFLRRHVGEPWPDLSDATLVGTLEQWLAPYLAGCTGRSDLEGLDLAGVLRAMLPGLQRAELDDLAPTWLVLPSGRRHRIDYGGTSPVLAVRAQELFGVRSHPTVAGGRVPLVVHVLSPAGRPIQVTSDLPGFWAGSWREARREMAGRYPKHAWPQDPASAPPPRT